MINKNNELPSFVNKNNLPKIVDKLTDASNIKITGNKYGNRVQTVIDKIVEKTDDITKAIEQEVVNNSYSFKVGTGDVDVSSDVEDGFGEVGIKGVTYQNLAPKGVALCDDASKFTHNYLHVTVTQQNGFVQCVTNQEGYCILGYDNRHYNNLIQPNKCYITLAEVEIIKDTSNEGIYVAIPSYISYKEKKLQGEITKGVIAKAFKTNSDVTTNNNGWLAIRLTNNSTSVGDGFKCYYVSLFEISEAEFNNLSIDELIERYNYKCEGIVGIGDKSKNLFNKDNIKQTVLNLGTAGSNCDEVVSQVRCSLRKISCKPNTKYTIKSDKEINAAIGSIGNNNIALGDSNWRNIYNSYTYTTPSDAIELAVNIAKTDNTNIDIDYVKNFNIQIEEGETSTSYEPYYDGHKIEILSQGKNLYKPNLQIKSANGLTFSLHGNTLIVNGTCTKIVDFRPINGTESITLELYNYVNKLPVGTTLKLSNNLGLKNFFSLKRNGAQTYPANTLIIQEGDYGISCFVRFEEGQSYNNAELKIQLEINNVATEFEPYIEDKTQILLDEPLMRLPNGVCDEITRDGELIRRVGKVVLDGSEAGWKSYADKEDCWMFAIDNYPSNLKHRLYENTNLICDITPIGNLNIEKKQRSIFVYGHTANNELRYAIPKTILAGNGTHLFKQWLSQNPTTVYYELAEPIATELPAPCLRIFKDGHLTFNTLVAPESTHVVQLNKSGQIQNAIKESQSLDNRIDVLENNYDTLMLSTISRLNDLELNYTLK